MRCETCRFFCACQVDEDRNMIRMGEPRVVVAGECRRHPPVRVDFDPLARFPLVAACDWCGHHAQ
jgi:hypothetical protein